MKRAEKDNRGEYYKLVVVVTQIYKCVTIHRTVHPKKVTFRVRFFFLNFVQDIYNTNIYRSFTFSKSESNQMSFKE